MIESSKMQELIQEMYQYVKTTRGYNFPDMDIFSDAVRVGSNYVPPVIERLNPLDGVGSVKMYSNRLSFSERLGYSEITLTSLPEDWVEKAQFFVDNGYSAKILVDGKIDRLNHDDTVSLMRSLVELNKRGHRLLPEWLFIRTEDEGFRLKMRMYGETKSFPFNLRFSYGIDNVEEKIPLKKLENIINSNPEVKGKARLIPAGQSCHEKFLIEANSELDALNVYRIILESQPNAIMSPIGFRHCVRFSTKKLEYLWYVAHIPTGRKRKTARSEPLSWKTKDIVFRTPGLKDIASIELNKGKGYGQIRITMKHEDIPVLISGRNKEIVEIVEQISS